MNDQLLKQLIKQMKILNFWVTLFGGIMLVAIIIIGFLLFQLASFIGKTNEKIDNATSSVDIKQKACDGDGSFSEFLNSKTAACEE